MVARFDLTQRLEYSDNPDLDANKDADFFGRTLLNWGLSSETAIERFSLNLGTELEEFRNDQSSIDWDNSYVNLAYSRGTPNARLSTNARYQESDTTNDDFDDDFSQDGNVINQNSGTRRSYGFDIRGAVGQEAPIGASGVWSYNKITFHNTDDSDLDDSSRNDISGQVDFRIDPRIVASLTAKYFDYDARGNGVDRKTKGFGTAFSFEVSPILTSDLGVSYDRVKRSGDDEGTDEGVSLNFGMLRQMPNGTLGLRVESDVSSNDNGRRSFISVSRDMDLPRGSLSMSFGLTGADTIGTDPLVDVDYRQQRSSAVLSFGLSQNVVTDDDNNEQINTTLRAAYDREINNVSSFGLGLTLFDRNELQDNGNDGRRVSLTVSYRHDLTQDWGLVGGYSHTYSTEDDDDNRRRNTIFVGLQRSFTWNP